jgi:hypothetical protein
MNRWQIEESSLLMHAGIVHMPCTLSFLVHALWRDYMYSCMLIALNVMSTCTHLYKCNAIHILSCAQTQMHVQTKSGTTYTTYNKLWYYFFYSEYSMKNRALSLITMEFQQKSSEGESLLWDLLHWMSQQLSIKNLTYCVLKNSMHGTDQST